MKKYVWLNVNTGEFSNSWPEEQHKDFGEIWSEKNIAIATENGFKLIEYTCLTDTTFEFMDKMKLR